MLIYWIKTGIVGFSSIFFLFWGIDNLISAYRLTHPQTFVVYFFSSNLIILISLTGLLFSIIRIFNFVKNKRTNTP